MSKKDEFKSFVSNKPELAKYIENGQMTWQKFYELYDIYGEDSSVWNDYSRKETVNTDSGVSKINELFKSVDMNSIKEHINTAQKALDFVQELTGKSTDVISKTPVTPRPLNKFFED
ncbi:MAG: hypothetical protein IJO63_05200 [Bacilli bacterium]|nr:hypothetical protein [Bacilli bacterium]